MKQNEDELQYKIIELFLAGVDKSKYDFFEQSLLKEILHLQYSEINKKKKAFEMLVSRAFGLLNYLTSVNTTCLRSFGEYFFN